MRHQSLMYTPFCPQGVNDNLKNLEKGFVWISSDMTYVSPLLTWFSDFCKCNSTSHLVSPFFLTSTFACLSYGFISCSCLVLLLQPFSSLPLSHHRPYQTHTLSSFAVPVWCSSSELPPSVPCKCQPLNLYLVSSLQTYHNNNNKLHTHMCVHMCKCMFSACKFIKSGVYLLGCTWICHAF